MKIYIQPIDKEFQPDGIIQPYPQYNSQYGVEQDMIAYLEKHNITTPNKEEADWVYLPIFWTRWHVNHGWSSWGRDILQNYVNSLNLNYDKVFTVCQYDDGPISDLKTATVFLSSRKTDRGIDIPLLASPLQRKKQWKDKTILASFSGIFSTHPFRQKMADSLKDTKNVFLYNGNYGTEHFVNLMENSQIALCPRGYGGSSFRFYEAMQLGAIPFLIGDIDTRPFKEYINWEACSFYLDDPNRTGEFLENIDISKLEEMSRNTLDTWDKIKYGEWCNYVIRRLE